MEKIGVGEKCPACGATDTTGWGLTSGYTGPHREHKYRHHHAGSGGKEPYIVIQCWRCDYRWFREPLYTEMDDEKDKAN